MLSPKSPIRTQRALLDGENMGVGSKRPSTHNRRRRNISSILSNTEINSKNGAKSTLNTTKTGGFGHKSSAIPDFHNEFWEESNQITSGNESFEF